MKMIKKSNKMKKITVAFLVLLTSSTNVFAIQSNEVETFNEQIYLESLEPLASTFNFDGFVTESSWLAPHLVPTQQNIAYVVGSTVFRGVVTRTTSPIQVSSVGSNSWGANFRGTLTNIGNLSYELLALDFLDEFSSMVVFLDENLYSVENDLNITAIKETLISSLLVSENDSPPRDIITSLGNGSVSGVVVSITEMKTENNLEKELFGN